jgi:hypothetical protein
MNLLNWLEGKGLSLTCFHYLNDFEIGLTVKPFHIVTYLLFSLIFLFSAYYFVTVIPAGSTIAGFWSIFVKAVKELWVTFIADVSYFRYQIFLVAVRHGRLIFLIQSISLFSCSFVAFVGSAGFPILLNEVCSALNDWHGHDLPFVLKNNMFSKYDITEVVDKEVCTKIIMDSDRDAKLYILSEKEQCIAQEDAIKTVRNTCLLGYGLSVVCFVFVTCVYLR